MGCIGPGYDDEKTQIIYDEFIELLKTKYHILDYESMPFWYESRQKALIKLKNAIREIVFQDDCELF